ncbi:beta-amyrin 11-oxidase-like [Trifolium pratense]|uniref:beta-amyrin 11-oxidase-like n=1 Tax=Trifolium pratense TaxID=57577 RepID=UPI001E69024E|nr:beta-amyrin 11-oxidase-like [Trifolium pratense]
MKFQWFWMYAATLLACYIFVNKVLRNLNDWYYDLKLRKRQYPLPPGDMGWPLIGNLWPFFKYFSSGRRDMFINNIFLRYGRTGIYKTHLYGSPSIIVTTPDMCKKVLTDEETFKMGYPKAFILILAPNRILSEHGRLKRLVAAPIAGHNVSVMYLECIKDIVINKLEELSNMRRPIEFLNEMSKAGKKLDKIVQYIIDERRVKAKNRQIGEKNDLLDILFEIKDKGAEKFEDKDIIDVLVSFLFGGHDSIAASIMWTIMHLTQDPLCLKKAKEEQEEIMKARPSSQKRLSNEEIKNMVYLSQVVDETLRYRSTFSTFREATIDVNINGYFIPKGWKVLVWLSAMHMAPEHYSNPEEYNPSRWDDYNPATGSFLPFGIGRRLCPGRDLARYEMTIFLHYFVLNYRLELINPECPLTSLPFRKPVDNCLAKVIKLSDS